MEIWGVCHWNIRGCHGNIRGCYINIRVCRGKHYPSTISLIFMGLQQGKIYLTWTRNHCCIICMQVLLLFTTLYIWNLTPYKLIKLSSNNILFSANLWTSLVTLYWNDKTCLFAFCFTLLSTYLIFLIT